MLFQLLPRTYLFKSPQKSPKNYYKYLGYVDQENDSKYQRGTTFTQNKKPKNRASTSNVANYRFTFHRKVHKKSSLGNNFDSKLEKSQGQNTQSDKNKIVHTLLIHNLNSEPNHTDKADKHKDDSHNRPSIQLKTNGTNNNLRIKKKGA